MKFQIIGPDKRAAIDGTWCPVNLDAFGWHPAYHAVQYDDDKGSGHIEWVKVGGVTPPNQAINRDQLLAMFGPLIEHCRTMIEAQKVIDAARKSAS